MDYEKKYKEAFKEAEKIHKFSSDIAEIKRMEQIFPELKESEDERIRKFLIEDIKDTLSSEDFKHYNPEHTKKLEEALTWLEKQGERKSVDDLTPQEAMDIAVSKCFEQDEQKSADKVESKFKVGDWIISKYMHLVMQILNNDNESYKTVETDGTERNDSYDFIERNFKLWTIDDAKDGDVLVDIYGNIGIFEKRYGINWHTYCYLGYKGRFISEGGSHGSICYPATKEQRDLLFSKMKETGYEWNEEKKKLKKASQRMISAEVKEAMYAKPAWSEEDEITRKTLVNIINAHYKDCFGKTEKCLLLNWLKYLKQRIGE